MTVWPVFELVIPSLLCLVTHWEQFSHEAAVEGGKYRMKPSVKQK